MKDNYNLLRFLDAQNKMYLQALYEVKKGKKASQWMWFIFPRLDGCEEGDTARFYAISSLDEACAFLAHPILRRHLIEITQELAQLKGRSALEIFGAADEPKLHASMTLFAIAEKTNPIFEFVLEKYFDNQRDALTLELLDKEIIP
jgi:uncharacterized protein (DUF1810 family)